MVEADSDQAAVLDFMASPEAYEAGAGDVERIETHASVVLLAGSRAYKVKRAVKYPFLDFSTLENRHRALCNELVINRRTAPQLYLEVIPITRGRDGKFHVGIDTDDFWLNARERRRRRERCGGENGEQHGTAHANTPLGQRRLCSAFQSSRPARASAGSFSCAAFDADLPRFLAK